MLDPKDYRGPQFVWVVRGYEIGSFECQSFEAFSNFEAAKKFALEQVLFGETYEEGGRPDLLDFDFQQLEGDQSANIQCHEVYD